MMILKTFPSKFVIAGRLRFSSEVSITASIDQPERGTTVSVEINRLLYKKDCAFSRNCEI